MSWKKLFFLLGIFLFLLLLPLILCTTPVLEWFEACVAENPKGSMAPWTQITVADIFFFTGRTKQAKEAYTRFIDLYPDDERYPAALYSYAACLDEMRKVWEATQAYEVFLEKFPNDPMANNAREAIERLRITK